MSEPNHAASVAQQSPIICRLCITAYPTLADEFSTHGCEGEHGVHTPEVVVLAYVLAAAVNGVRTTDVFAQAFADDAADVIDLLGPAERWTAWQNPENCDDWLINGISFNLDYGSTGEGGGTLVPVVPERGCPACHESVGWAVLTTGERCQIECKGCGQDLTIDRWWPVVRAASDEQASDSSEASAEMLELPAGGGANEEPPPT
jgi:hypothetical protein